MSSEEIVNKIIEKYKNTEKNHFTSGEYTRQVDALNDYLVENIPDTDLRLNVLSIVLMAHMYIRFSDEIVNRDHFTNVITLYASLVLGALAEEKYMMLTALKKCYEIMKKDCPDLTFSDLFSRKMHDQKFKGK